MSNDPGNNQWAPYPHELQELVERLVYRPGWTFSFRHIDRGQGSVGMTLDITTSGYNSYHPEQGPNYQVHHYMPVPPAAYNALSWRRWLFDQLLLVERHECMEFFTLKPMAQGEHWERPYAPHHGLGEDPYIVHEQGSEEAVRTNFKGQVKE